LLGICVHLQLGKEALICVSLTGASGHQFIVGQRLLISGQEIQGLSPATIRVRIAPIDPDRLRSRSQRLLISLETKEGIRLHRIAGSIIRIDLDRLLSCVKRVLISVEMKKGFGLQHVVYHALLFSTEANLTIGPHPGMLGSLTLIAVAAQTMRRVLGQGSPAERGPAVLLEETAYAFWKTWLVSVLVLIFALLLVSLAIQHANAYTPARLQVVEVGGTSILIMLVLRQLSATHELNSLKRELREKKAQLDKLAACDALTGVPNYRTLLNTLDEELERAKVQQTTCSVLFVDIDSSKAINDQYGHAVGDLVLCRVAGVAASLLHSQGCLGRLGGEEFVAVLPGHDSAEAFTVAERIRTRVSEQIFAGQEDLHVTCSLGVATYPQTATEQERLLLCAD